MRAILCRTAVSVGANGYIMKHATKRRDIGLVRRVLDGESTFRTMLDAT